jgi:ADP-heptose:LPS heptosyltransferase
VGLLRHADLFIGPSSGPLNLAAAVQTDAFGLFGNTPVLTYSKFIHGMCRKAARARTEWRRYYRQQCSITWRLTCRRRNEQD